MRKHSLCCYLVSICPSVCPSVCHICGSYCQTSFFGPIAPSFAILISSARTQFQGNPFFGEGGKNTRAVGKFCDFRLKSPHVAVAA